MRRPVPAPARIASLAVSGAIVALVSIAGPVRAQGAPGAATADSGRAVAADSAGAARADSLDALGRFLRQLSDSTSGHHPAAAAPLDTAGLDSALARGLAGGAPPAPPRRLRPEIGPWFQFDRVDGPVMGGALSIGWPAREGRLSGRAAWASGPDLALGGGEYFKRWGRPRGAAAWSFTAYAGRTTDVLDLDRRRQLFATISAFLNGGDRHHYLRRDGVRATLVREGLLARWRLGVRHQLESPRVTTATWTLTGAEPQVIGNFPAAPGRNTELQLTGSLRPAHHPVWLEVDTRLGVGAFDYRRLRAGAGADLPLGAWGALVPQASYGTLGGDLAPQNGFWLGGPSSLRSLPSYAAAGDHFAFTRLEMVVARDLVRALGGLGPSWLNLAPVAFAGGGAVWGRDPLGGPNARGGGWPERRQWRSEAGFGFYYRPGLPDPDGYFRFLWAQPLGPGDDGARISVSYSRPLDQLRFHGD